GIAGAAPVEECERDAGRCIARRAAGPVRERSRAAGAVPGGESLKRADGPDDLGRLEEQIRQLKVVAEQHGLDVGDEIRLPEEKAAHLGEASYLIMTAAEPVQRARHPRGPYSLDFMDRGFTDFIELRGDRNFRDDEAIVCGWARLDGRS